MEKENSILIDKAIDYIKEFFKGDSTGHDYEHSMRVYRLGLRIAKSENANTFLVSLACLLHDVDDRKISESTSKNKDNARTFLKENKVNDEVIEKIIEIINEVSYKGKDSVIPRTIESKCVQDADRLDAIGAIGIARAFAYGGAKKRKMYDPSVKPINNLSESEYYKSESTTINHFYEKLLLLKDMLNTDEAKEIAINRHAFLEEFLDEFINEWESNK